MSYNLKKHITILTLITLLALPLFGVLNCCSAEDTPQDTTLKFLEDVAGIDIAKYQIKTINVLDMNVGIADKSIKYVFESDGRKIEVSSLFKNDNLVWCKINNLAGSLILNVPTGNSLDSAKSLMDRYQTFSKAPYLKPIRDSLNTLTELKSITVETDNVKLEVYTEGDFSRFYWKDTVKGIEIPQKAVGLVYYNGTLRTFSDHWNCYTIGSSDVNFDREKAIQTAKELAEKYSYTIGNTVVDNFTVVDEYIIAELTMQNRGECVLYPWWEIRLPLDDIYPGYVTEIRVLMWADTGEITYVQAIGGGGGNVVVSSEETSNPTATYILPTTDALPENENNSVQNLLLVSGIVALMIAVGATVTKVFIKKKKK